MSKFKPNASSAGLKPLPRKTGATAGLLNQQGSGVTVEPVAASSDSGTRSSPSLVPTNGIQRIGFNALLAYIFFRFSFLHEVISGKLNVDTHLIITLSIVCYTCALISGRIAEGFRDKITWMWLGFAGLMTLASITSFWKGGSIPMAVDLLRTAFPLIVVVPALVVTKSDVRKVLCALGLACISLVMLGLSNNDFKTGRMSVNAVNSDIQDSNDYAAHVILLLPALVFFTMRPGKSPAFKILGVLMLMAGLYEVLSTGSRGGLLSIGLTTIYVAFIGTRKLRIGLFVGVPVLALATIPLIPSESAARLKTLFSSNVPAVAQEAEDSSDARRELLKQSIKITFEHPLQGLGPGEFMDYQAQDAKSEGERGMWHVTHNAYTEVSSECGIPALILYLSAVGSTIFLLRRAMKSPDAEMKIICATLSVMIVAFSICIIFLSLAYNVQILILSGTAVAIGSILKEQSPEPARVAAA